MFYDILKMKKKNTFYAIKTRSSTSRKIDIFPFFIVLVQKWPFFDLFILGNTGQENVFYDILELKNNFLGYKNKKFFFCFLGNLDKEN